MGAPVVGVTPGRWGFTNRTDLVTLASGERIVLQQFRRRKDAAYRLRILQELRGPAGRAGIPIPAVRRFDLEASPPWAIYETLPGVPLPEAGEAALDGPRFPVLARRMGELLARWRGLPADRSVVNDEWADLNRVAERATTWAAQMPELSERQRAAVARVLGTSQSSSTVAGRFWRMEISPRSTFSPMGSE